MKRVLISIFIFLLIISSSILALVFINSKKNQCSELLNNAYQSAIQSDYISAKENTEKFIKKWDKNEKLLMIFVHRQDVDDITFTAREILEYIKEKEIPEYLAGTKRIMALLDHTFETEMPYFENIF